MNVLGHWREADELPRCQHCPALADERSFMCEDHASEADEEVQTLRDYASEADEEVQTLRDQLRGAVALMDDQWDRVLWWLRKPVPPGPAKALDESIIRAINAQRGQ
jgi:hypothetical protein